MKETPRDHYKRHQYQDVILPFCVLRRLFGSVARGEAGADSDLDLLYVLAPGRHLGFSINRLEDELAELFGRPVDLVSKTALHRAIRDDVLAEARELYAA